MRNITDPKELQALQTFDIFRMKLDSLLLQHEHDFPNILQIVLSYICHLTITSSPSEKVAADTINKAIEIALSAQNVPCICDNCNKFSLKNVELN